MLMAPAHGEQTGTGLHAIYLNYWYEPHMRSIEDLLASYSTLTYWTRALAAEGVPVTVVQRFGHALNVMRDGVRFVLVPDGYGPHLNKWQVPLPLHRAARRCCEASGERRTVVHVNSLQFPLQLRALRAVLPRESAIVVQHHAEKPWSGLRGRGQSWGLRAADGFLFAAAELASGWRQQGLISGDQPVYEVMEGSTEFRRQDRATARAQTGITGDPVVLWVGRLIALKDPLTVLRGFELILRRAQGARLYMAYSDDSLLSAVRDYVAQSPGLASSVTLLGRLPHPELGAVYNSADYFVLGSHYEGSGYALVEALACGVVPVVTDIASFRALTDQGRIGACWPPGDSVALSEAFVRARSRPWQSLSDQAVQFFDQHLSWAAIARKAISAYREAAGRRA
jgi:glycosyltransferase involved in cell wall biosynthesis